MERADTFILSSFPGGAEVKASPCNVGDLGSIPGSGRTSGEGNGNPLQYSCLENLMDRGAWQATVHGIARVGHNLATKPPPLIFSFFVCSWPHNAACRIFVHQPGIESVTPEVEVVS